MLILSDEKNRRTLPIKSRLDSGPSDTAAGATDTVL